MCKACGANNAKYKCKECGTKLCVNCINVCDGCGHEFCEDHIYLSFEGCMCGECKK